MNNHRPWLFGCDLAQLRQITGSLDMPRFTAGQIASWLYKKGACRIDDMTDISLRNREALAKKYQVGRVVPSKETVSADGTKKYLFPTIAGADIESAYIPDRGRATLCVSSQAGCRMGCRFCATGSMGFSHDVTAGEIINQVASIPGAANLTNIVYMGMGEPMDNLEEVMRSLDILTSPWGYAWSPTRITVSTCGMLPEIETLLRDSKVHIAVSLHNPFPEQRMAVMPIQNAHPIAKIVEALKKYDFSHQRRLSFEYIVMSGINDSAGHINEMARLLDGLACRINLIRFHRIPGSPYFSPDTAAMEAFRDALSRKGIVTTIRQSRGEDIKAACGLLAAGR